MKKQTETMPVRWRKLPGDERHLAEAFLRKREKYYVGAVARFLRIQEEKKGRIWYLNAPGQKISALLLHHRQALFPAFDRNSRIPGPRFLNRFLGKIHIHALQGLLEDAELLESLMENQGYYSAERIDYDLMYIDDEPAPEAFRAGPAGLVLRPPVPEDEEFLFYLQSAYEQEEVLPKAAVFDPASCRYNLSRILSSEHVLVAELDGQVVAKINTSAKTFTRYQIGGVYVRPDCRGLGIGMKMTSAFVRRLLKEEGKGITLFVKKRNAPARAVYRKIGFKVLADYRICYF